MKTVHDATSVTLI